MSSESITYWLGEVPAAIHDVGGVVRAGATGLVEGSWNWVLLALAGARISIFGDFSAHADGERRGAGSRWRVASERPR